MEIKPEYRRKAIRSYVIRSGRMTEGQKAAYEKHWDIYGLELDAGKFDSHQLFGDKSKLVVEIGFGMGDSLHQMCVESPATQFIGIEVHTPGVGRLMNSAAASGISNLKIYLADAKDVLQECFEDASIDRIQIYFPDPWHKKKHHKRRLIEPAFVATLASKIKPDGLLHLATDWENYAEQMRDVVESSGEYQNHSGVGQFSPRPSWRPETKFERRGQKLGHGVWDLIYKKNIGTTD